MSDAGRRVLITGSAGFLGEATLDQLTAGDSSPLAVCVDTRPTSGPAGETRRFISVVRDVTEPLDDILVDNEIDTVVHLAFLLQSQRDPAQARRVNVEATEQLLRSCAKANISQFIYLSSSTVYGAHPDNTRPFTEDDPVNPVKGFTYSEHKVEAEQMVLRFGEENPDCAVSIMRGCVVMGPGTRNFITDSLGLRFLPVPAGFDPEMQFLHIDDYKTAVQAVFTQRSRGIFNIAGSGTISWRGLVRMSGATSLPAPVSVLRAATDLTWKIGLQNRANSAGLAFIQYPWTVSIDKMESELGWAPKRTSEDAVRAWASDR